MPTFNNATVVAALVAAAASLLIAIFNFFNTRRNQRELKALEEKQAEKDARRDYEYEARKRLYQEYEPLFFQLVEASNNALRRICSLARTARDGNLNSDRGGWLSLGRPQPYYLTSTIYRLLCPLAYIKLIQRSLTLVDLTVDSHLSNQYLLAKWLYVSFKEDFELASIHPKIKYDPNCEGCPEKRRDYPQEHWPQGVTVGGLDNAVEALLVQETNGVMRCMSYGEFENAYDNPITCKKFSVFTDLFLGFHPRTRPVLWRILILQAHFYEALLRAREMKLIVSNKDSTTQSSTTLLKRGIHSLQGEQPMPQQRQGIQVEPVASRAIRNRSSPNRYSTDSTPKLLKSIARKNLRHYDWYLRQKEATDQNPEEVQKEEEMLVEPFKVAQVYLQEILGPMCDFEA